MFKKHPTFTGLNRERTRGKYHTYLNSDQTVMRQAQRDTIYHTLHSLGRTVRLPGSLLSRLRSRRDVSTHDPSQLTYTPPAGLIAAQLLGGRVIR